MSVVTSPSEAGFSVVAGAAEVAFVHRDGATRLAHLHQRDPLRVLFPRPDDPSTPVAVLATTSGGLVGGDRLAIKAMVGDAGSALFTTQSAEKIYRSTGRDCRVDVGLFVGPGAWMEWLPHETIVFNKARLRRSTVADVAAGGRLMAIEAVVFGRIARGERLTQGLVRDEWKIRRGGRLVWADALHLDDDLAWIGASPAGLDGAVGLATFVYVADDAAEHLNLTRALMPANDGNGLKVGATVVNGVLVARWLARDALAMRTSIGVFWEAFRRRVGGRAGGLPRVWSN